VRNHVDTSTYDHLDGIVGDDVAGVVEGMRPHDLCAALQLAASDAATLLGVRVDMRYAGTTLLPAGLVAIVEDIVREAFDNVARHACTNDAAIDVSVDDQVWLRVRDHGVGFDVTAVRPDDPDGTTRFSAIARTVRAAGGTIVVMSAPHEGTIVRVCVPVAL
jgi:signal transduction histidine kinase